MADNRVGYLPRELAEALRRKVPPEVSESDMFELERLAERIWAEGYDQGHLRGYHEGRDHKQRPNINDVNRLREALAAEGKAERG